MPQVLKATIVILSIMIIVPDKMKNLHWERLTMILRPQQEGFASRIEWEFDDPTIGDSDNDESLYFDGSYCAEVGYYNPNTGTRSDINSLLMFQIMN